MPAMPDITIGDATQKARDDDGAAQTAGAEPQEQLVVETGNDGAGADAAWEAPLWYTVLVGVAFCTLFIAFFTMQSLLTSVVGANGFLAIVVLYVFMLLGSFLSPAIVMALGPRLSMLVAAFTYTFMNVGAAVTAMDGANLWVLFLSSACCGFGAGSLWCGQGMCVRRCRQHAQRIDLFLSRVRESWAHALKVVYFVFVRPGTK